ncbi:MAG: aminotransferase class I and II [Chloroflexi bacterium]|nr:MAG: aminotransferase class I and II [Chloroflexota bacterium]
MLTAIRYVTPLREGGSLPAVVEADDGELYVMKFSGAGQGPKVLIAELVAGEIGRALGLRVPDLVLLHLDPALGRNERNPEIRDLLNASAGLNLGMRFLSGAFAFNPLLEPFVTPELASAIVWFDAYVTNVDRTPRNANLLLWEEELWLIDHGASLYFHYDWSNYLERSETPFPHIRQHILIDRASQVTDADATLRPLLNESVLGTIVEQIPTEWLDDEPPFDSPDAQRTGYLTYLIRRLTAAPVFVEEAVRAHAEHV